MTICDCQDVTVYEIPDDEEADALEEYGFSLRDEFAVEIKGLADISPLIGQIAYIRRNKEFSGDNTDQWIDAVNYVLNDYKELKRNV